MVKLPQRQTSDIPPEDQVDDDGHPISDDPADFWTPQERRYFEDLRSIEHANLKIQEKKYYTGLASILFQYTNYYDREYSIKTLLWTKCEL